MRGALLANHQGVHDRVRVDQLLQLCSDFWFVSGGNSELLAIGKTVFFVLYAWPSQFSFGHTTVRTSHVFFSGGGLEEFNRGELWLSLLPSSLHDGNLGVLGIELALRRHVLVSLVVFRDRIPRHHVFFVKSLVSLVVVSRRVLHLAVNRGLPFVFDSTGIIVKLTFFIAVVL